jgi:hypothetical protein
MLEKHNDEFPCVYEAPSTMEGVESLYLDYVRPNPFMQSVFIRYPCVAFSQ